MNLNFIRSNVSKLRDKEHLFLYKMGRGQDEKFYGKIIHLFPRIFIILTNDNKIKSFSYNDFLIKTIKIIDFSKKVL